MLSLLELRRLLVSENRRRRRKLPRPPKQLEPRGAAIRFRKELRELTAIIEQEVRRLLFPELPTLLALAPNRSDAAAARVDAFLDELVGRLLQRLRESVDARYPRARAERAARVVAEDVSAFNREQVDRQFQRVLGIGLPTSDQRLREQLDVFVKSNVDLITSIPAQLLDKVEATVGRAVRSGLRVENLREQIERDFGATRARADLIARDQVLKVNSELTQMRQREAGVQKYEWSSSLDERVRIEHRELNGKIFRWDDPPVVASNGDRGHPGEYFQCRCVAIPVIELPGD